MKDVQMREMKYVDSLGRENRADTALLDAESHRDLAHVCYCAQDKANKLDAEEAVIRSFYLKGNAIGWIHGCQKVDTDEHKRSPLSFITWLI